MSNAPSTTCHLHPLADVDAAQWTDVAQAAGAFAQISYVSAFQKYTNTDIHLAGLFQDDQLLGGMWIFERKRGPFRYGTIPPFTQYTPLVWDGAPPDSLIALLQKTYASAHALLPPTIEDVRPFQWANWQAEPRYTYHLDLTTDFQSKWSTNTRRIFKKHAANYIFKESMVMTSEAIALCAAGYARNQRRFPMDPVVLKKIVLDLADAEMIRTFSVTHTATGQVEAGVVVLHHQQMAHYWIAGSMPGPAMTVLLGHMLPILSAEGITTFDFVGANTPSIAEFKRRFGGTLTPYWQVSFATPLFRLARFFRR